MLTGSEETAELYTALRAVLGDEALKWLDDGLTAAADIAEDEVPRPVTGTGAGTGADTDPSTGPDRGAHPSTGAETGAGADTGPGQDTGAGQDAPPVPGVGTDTGTGPAADDPRTADTPGSTPAVPVRPSPSPLPAWEMRFAAAARRLGRAAARDRAARGSTPPGAPSGGPGTPPVGLHAPAHAGEPVREPADAARILLLHAARAGSGTLARLYDHGSAAERRSVLLALPYLPWLGPECVPLIEDALRANDTRLVAAAVGPYAMRYLDQHAWRHAVLKCLFTEVPVTAVAGLGTRARDDAELARMLTDYARERTAAGRPVPPDLYHALALTGTRPQQAPEATQEES